MYFTGAGECCTNIRFYGGGIEEAQSWDIGPAKRNQPRALGVYSYYGKLNNDYVYRYYPRSTSFYELHKKLVFENGTLETYWMVCKMIQKIVNKWS